MATIASLNPACFRLADREGLQRRNTLTPKTPALWPSSFPETTRYPDHGNCSHHSSIDTSPIRPIERGVRKKGVLVLESMAAERRPVPREEA